MDKKLKKEVKIFFVIPEGCSDDGVNDCMKMAYQEAVEADLSPKWLTAAESTEMAGSKTTVFILQEFAGDIFEKLSKTKSVRVCGPMCLRSCIAEGLGIPENKSAVFTTAMRNIVVTASQVPQAVKVEIKKKVGFMGGVYMNNLVESVTHLVTNAVRSSKYEIAGERGIPAMTVAWVDAVWQESQKRNIRATDPNFITNYKCPIFMNMNISCSNLSKSEKEEMKDLITKHGGTFTAQLHLKETTLLVLNEPRGDKYRAARRCDLPCVRPSYIRESVQCGYAVPSRGHLVTPSVSCSTPTKDDAPNFTCNSESISMINMDISKSHIDESQVTICTTAGTQQEPAKPSGSQHMQILSSLNVSDAKKAGSFVDGCKIYLSGFTDVEMEKLRRILSLGGATVFSEMCESISHVLIGEFIVNDIKSLSTMVQKPRVVTLDWVVASLKQQSPASEDLFSYLETKKVMPEPPSPLSQKSLRMLHPVPAETSEATNKMPPPAGPPVNRKLLSEFLTENSKSPAKNNVSAEKSVDMTATSVENTGATDVFQGFKFLIAGFDAEVTSKLEAAIAEEGGCVVAPNFTGVADYAIVPVQTTIPNITAVEVVTNLWVEECLDSAELVGVKYYHQPLSLSSDKQPLVDCCISISSYGGKEKMFLVQLARELGAIYQDVFARVSKQEKGILASTHLICPKPEGQKYNAATKWKLPVVTKDWLLTCARQGVKVSETLYCVGDVKDTSISEQTTSRSVTVTPQRTTTSLPPPPEPLPVTPGPAPGPSHPTVSSLKRKSTTQTPEEDYSPFHVSTPDTPYGQVFETPTAEVKKGWKRFIDQFPDMKPTSPVQKKNSKRLSTPLSEIKRRIFAAALETSSENIKPSNSNEDLENEQSTEATNHLNEETVRQDLWNTQTPASGKKKKLDATPQSSSKQNCENFQPRKLSYGRATPTAGDFRTSSCTPLSASKMPPPQPQNTSLVKESKSDNQSELDEKSQMVKKPLPNERVSTILGKLHKRLSTPGTKPEEQPLPQRELVHQPIVPDKPVTVGLVTDSQPVTDWEDPVESAERAKIQNKSSTADRPRRFALSSVVEKEKYEEKLRQLGETVLTSDRYDAETTHLIVDEPLRSEKLLCSMAAGKWILHTSYIDLMVQHKQYMPEELNYEWGNPDNAKVLPRLEPGSLSEQLAQAAVRWRRQLAERGGGAFSGMRAILLASASKFDSYKRFIEAGSGQTISATNVAEATHCFVEEKRIATMPVPLSKFIAYKVPCLPPVFLSDLLTKFPPPSTEDSLIAEYRRLSKGH